MKYKKGDIMLKKDLKFLYEMAELYHALTCNKDHNEECGWIWEEGWKDSGWKIEYSKHSEYLEKVNDIFEATNKDKTMTKKIIEIL